MFAIGFLFGYEVVYRIFKHEGAPEKWVGTLFIYVVLPPLWVQGWDMFFSTIGVTIRST